MNFISHLSLVQREPKTVPMLPMVRVLDSSQAVGFHHLKHVFDAGLLRSIIASWVIGGFSNFEQLDHTINDEHGSTFAAHCMAAKVLCRSSFVGQNDVKGLGEVSLCVCDKLDQIGGSEALILLPGAHDSTIVHANDDDLVDPSPLKSAVNFGCLEARDLARGSGGRKCPRERDDECLLCEQFAHRLERLEISIHHRPCGECCTN